MSHTQFNPSASSVISTTKTFHKSIHIFYPWTEELISLLVSLQGDIELSSEKDSELPRQNPHNASFTYLLTSPYVVDD